LCRTWKRDLCLVKTSNPGSSVIQDLSIDGCTISEKIATWLNTEGEKLKGECGFSGLGAVVGATYPEQAKKLRKIMPHNYFLIPGLSAQGAGAEDACAGFSKDKNGAVANVSRGLLGKLNSDMSEEEIKAEISKRADNFNNAIHAALNK